MSDKSNENEAVRVISVGGLLVLDYIIGAADRQCDRVSPHLA